MPTEEDGDATLSPDEAFARLGNDTRFGVLQALGEADEPLSFSALRERVGMTDSGQFNYHLDQLVGQFVADDDEGYRLTPAGERVVEAVLSGAVTETPTLDSERVDQPCSFCGTLIEISWDGSGIGLYCPGCAGQFGHDYTRPDDEADRGYLGRLPVPPAVTRDRDPEGAYRTAWTWGNLEILAMSSELCPRCSGSVEYTLRVCEDHDATGGVCETCDNRHRIGLGVDCENCIFDSGGAFVIRLVAHTAMLSFLTDHGYNPVAPDAPQQVNEVHEDYEEELLSRDPFRARFTFAVDDERLTMTVDDDLEVVETVRESR